MPESSGAALARKLGFDHATSVALVHAPSDLDVEVPAGVVTRRVARGAADVVLAFFVRRFDLDREIDRLAELVFPAGAMWVAWPKRTSSVASDLSDNEVRAVGLGRDLVDTKVCAVDATWSALRFVWRKERRSR